MGKTISQLLRIIDGRGYKAYKSLVGAVEPLGNLWVRVARVQGDPFAPPSVLEVEVRGARVPVETDPVPLADYLHRLMAETVPMHSMSHVGEGNSGKLQVPRPSPIVIPRSAVEARRGRDGRWNLLFRVWVGLPSRGRKVLGDVAEELLLRRLPRAVLGVVESLERDSGRLREHAMAWVEQESIRKTLPSLGLVGFIGDGSILPRRCGGCWEPLENAVPFESPPSLRVEIELPTGRIVAGMGVPRGVTTITGPAFHGKTTLAEALASGVLNHVPGDGRELVVSDSALVYVESENGRWVSCVDVSPFIEHLPGHSDTRCFSTSDASGATSIAASVQEYAEAGASGFIIDEDQAATNMLHRDAWAEEITGKRTLNPLSEMAPRLSEAGISLVIVASGALPLLASSDRIVVMDEFRARDATFKRSDAERVLREMGYARIAGKYSRPARRILEKPFRIEKPKVRGFMLESRSLRDRLDLRPMRQIMEEQQATTAVRVAASIADGRCVDLVEKAWEASRRLWEWDYSFLPGAPGPDISYVRPFEILFVVNRLPGLKVCHSRYCRERC